MSDDENKWYICEVGSGRLRHGIFNDENVAAANPKNCVGIPNYSYVANQCSDMNSHQPKYSKEKYNAMLFGDALDSSGEGSQAGMCHIKWPVERGVIKDREVMNDILHYELVTQAKLQLSTDEEEGLDSDIDGVIHLESIMGSTKGRMDTAAHYFDTVGIPKLFFGLSSVCALYGAGRTTGCAVMSGHGVTEVAPVFDGYAIKNAFRRYNWGGVDVTGWLGRELHKADVSLETSADELILWDIKEMLSVAPMGKLDDLVVEKREQTTDFSMPDNTVLQLREQVVDVAEIIFDPKRAGHDIPGLAQMTWNAIQRAPTDSKKALMDAIMLFGGNTMFGGLKDRMSQEMNAFSTAKGGGECKVVAAPERTTQAFAGACMLASYAEFTDPEDPNKAMWISKEEYMESGGQRIICMSQI
jgi:actin-related protein